MNVCTAVNLKTGYSVFIHSEALPVIEVKNHMLWLILQSIHGILFTLPHPLIQKILLTVAGHSPG